MSIKIRINQVEFRNNCNSNPSIDKGEFLIWYPDDRYEKLEEELCIVIAWLKYDKKEGCCTLESVGPRLLEMNNEEKKDFFEVYAIAEKKMNEVNEWELLDIPS